MPSFFRDATRDDRETEIVVEIDVLTWGEARTYEDPGCGPEVELIDAWLKADEGKADAPRITLTLEERHRIEEEFLEDPPEPDYPDDD
jgi:hypothetical protein